MPVPTRVPATGNLGANLARSRGTCPVKARYIGRCAECSCGRDLLHCSGIVPIVGQLVPTRMPQHVRVQRERHPGGLAEPLDEMMETDRAHWSAALGDEDVSLSRVLTSELA